MINTKSLYERDFAQWVENTVNQLNAKNTENLDWENLIEEIESLGRSQRKTVRSFLSNLLEHLLKRSYIPQTDCYRGWEIEIRNFRKELKQEFKDSPSLKPFAMEILAETYQDALESLREDYPDIVFPDTCPFTANLEALLTVKFWEDL
jgi:hypothetical protein